MDNFDNIRIFYTGDIPDDYYGNEKSTTVDNFISIIKEINDEHKYFILLDKHGIMTYLKGLCRSMNGTFRELKFSEEKKLCNEYGFNYAVKSLKSMARDC
jgi:hypothetical protein